MTKTFADLGLAQPLLDALTQAGYNNPTPIQGEAIPLLLEGRDLLASAATGTGKTAAFLLPSLNRLTERSEKPGRGPRVLVLTPTRELAAQVKTAAETYGNKIRHAKVVSVVGGLPYPVQNKLLSQPYEVLVATPGRLMDQMARGRIDFSRLEVLVLDEADRMLDLGFRDDIAEIARALPADRQTALFSATLEDDIARLAQSLLNNPARVEIAKPQSRNEQILEKLHYADDVMHKSRLLDHILGDESLSQAIVFISTKKDAADLADRLYADGHKAAALHGDMQQRERNRTLTQLRRGEVTVLVATDVAARGIDVAGISHVVNFDLPKFAEDYVHRIGRTGRAGREGIAISFASRADVPALRRIEKYTGRSIDPVEFSGLEARFKPRPGGFDGKGRGGSRNGGGGRGGKPGGYGGGQRGRDNNWGDRPSRFEGRGEQPRFGAPREGGFGQQREGGFGQREGGFGARNNDDRRTGGFGGGERAPRFGDRPQGDRGFQGNRGSNHRDDNFGNRADYPQRERTAAGPRGGFGQPRESFGNREFTGRTNSNNDRGGFGERRSGGFGRDDRGGDSWSRGGQGRPASGGHKSGDGARRTPRSDSPFSKSREFD